MQTGKYILLLIGNFIL